MTTPPVAPRRPHSTTHHGVTRDDPYAWLRAADWQAVFEDPETLEPDIRAYLEAENAYYEAEFASRTIELRETLFKEIRGRIKEDESGIPTPDGPFAYNSRMEEGRQYPVIVRTARGGVAWEPYAIVGATVAGGLPAGAEKLRQLGVNPF